MPSQQVRNPQLVVILGPAAVGKMTVGQALADATGYKLLYNHRVVDIATDLFDFGTPAFHRIARGFTLELLDTAAETGVSLILTHALRFGSPSARALLDDFSAAYLKRGGDVYCAELKAPLEVRLARNETENRALHKKVDWATPDRLRELETWGPWNSDGDFPYPERHVVIDNANIAPDAVARMIIERFGL